MKSRWTTYLLLVVVAAVWGIVAWKIFAPADNMAPAPRSESSVPVVQTAPADTLLLDYPDPFLKGASAVTAAVPLCHPRPACPQARSAQTRAGADRSPRNGALRRKTALYPHGRRAVRTFPGESAGEFLFTDCDRDSLYLRRAGVTYGVKLCD